MAEDQGSGERTEDATTKRREDFRKKGQVAQSREVQTAALLTILLLFWTFYLPHFFRNFSGLIAEIFESCGETEVSATAVMKLFFEITEQLAFLIMPLFLLVIIIGLFSSLIQVGWLLTGTPLQPDLNKLNPISGFGRIFSKKSLLEIFKSVFKVTLIGWIAYSTVYDNLEQAIILPDTSVSTAFVYLGKTAGAILLKVCAVLIFLAAIDYFFVRRDMEERMKMTKQEVKEEHKETEGDPHVRQQIRSIQRQMARRRMMAEVPKADVVVTNPTHFAVAIRYDAENMTAPTVVAKGADLIAQNIKKIARENNVPIVENPPVARLLHKVELGFTIPEELFKAVAEILAHVYSLKARGT